MKAKDRKFDDEVSRRRAEHITIGYGCWSCGFFGFDEARGLEDKIYDFLDDFIDDKYTWIDELGQEKKEIREALAFYFKSKKIANVMFNVSGGFYFHKLPF